jgi:hypothetical protein
MATGASLQFTHDPVHQRAMARTAGPAPAPRLCASTAPRQHTPPPARSARAPQPSRPHPHLACLRRAVAPPSAQLSRGRLLQHEPQLHRSYSSTACSRRSCSTQAYAAPLPPEPPRREHLPCRAAVPPRSASAFAAPRPDAAHTASTHARSAHLRAACLGLACA